MANNLNSLLSRVEKTDPALAVELRKQFEAFSRLREFGLNFEKHRPETVELHGRRVRVGDKVRFLSPRGSTRSARKDTWVVVSLGEAEGAAVAFLRHEDGDEEATRSLDDLVVIADFRDPIYPGLASTGRIERGGDKPFHAVINSENYHALEALLFAYEGMVDVIYIDPPYNTRDKDWKYNNDYVDPGDNYAHSKWLSMMERRLKLAKKLLNPTCSTLIVTIDEKEYLRLGLLLEQTFLGANIQMVTSVISAKGAVRPGRFSRVEEYIFFVSLGTARIEPWTLNMLDEGEDDEEVSDEDPEPENMERPIEWLGLRRREPSSTRGSRKNQFYPIFVNAEDGTLHSIGDPVDDDVNRRKVLVPPGTVALWPLKPSGVEMIWGLTPPELRRIWREGYARVNNWNAKKQAGTVKYLPSGTIDRVRRGEITITGRRSDGSIEGVHTVGSKRSVPPKRVWNMPSHNAELGGTKMLSALIPGRRFEYPKSLYAVEDTLRFVVGNNPDALILDYFCGSGTTTHAVLRLNRQDGGRRRSIAVTNNEVSSKEARTLRKDGFRPGDPEWEAIGISSYLSKPRIAAAATGVTPEGVPVVGDYKFTDEFPIAEGFEENVEFFDLTYQDAQLVELDMAFAAIAPLLWLRAGSKGPRIDERTSTFAVADTYAILFNVDAAKVLEDAIQDANSLRIIYVVTDDEKQFQMIASGFRHRVEVVQLYESYLRTFEINTRME